MGIARQSSRRVIGTIQLCLRNRFFTTSSYLQQDNPSQSPPGPMSRSSPQYNSISDASPEQSSSLIDEMSSYLKNIPMVGKKIARTGIPDRAIDFRPTDVSNLPNLRPKDVRHEVPHMPTLPIRFGELPGYFYIHGVSTTKNLHVTIADHKHNPIIVTSAGRHGLKHSKRQTVEAAYTTTVAAFEQLAKSNHVVNQVEIVLKGFGLGRRGFLSAIEGHHGEFLRQKVVRVTDATPLQIGYVKARNEKRN